jgi:hypothetical protein
MNAGSVSVRGFVVEPAFRAFVATTTASIFQFDFGPRNIVAWLVLVRFVRRFAKKHSITLLCVCAT